MKWDPRAKCNTECKGRCVVIGSNYILCNGHDSCVLASLEWVGIEWVISQLPKPFFQGEPKYEPLI